MSPSRQKCAVLLAAAALAACAQSAPPPAERLPARDPHSFSRPDEVAVRHLALDLDVDFAARRLRGSATLDIDNRAGAGELWLDTWDLDVRRVRRDGESEDAPFRLGEPVEHLGRPLVVDLAPGTRQVRIDYETSPDAGALQWLDPAQTAGGRRPFLLTQSESVFARTWFPCQDTPGTRSTYTATLRVPQGLRPLMSAVNPAEPGADGMWRFEMRQAIPTYLVALVVGELEFRSLGPRTGVWAEPPLLERAAAEFGDAERMLDVAESLYGPYRWGRYDLVVLPPSFPWGGMENPRLTFVTPTLLAGDRSLASTLAHEIAHSWSGNLVAAATWGDLWLNEGLTTYIERRIMEALHGREHAEMVAFVDQEGLRAALDETGPDAPDTRLRLELRDPEEAFGDATYEKGYLFFRLLEESVGREPWDAFLRAYFDDHAFSAVDTDAFLTYLREHLIARQPGAPALEASLRLDAWVDGPGLPDNRPEIDDSAFRAVAAALEAWLAGRPARDLETAAWRTQHWVQFLRSLPADLPAARLSELDEAFGFTDRSNAVVRQAWLLEAIPRDYRAADEALARYLQEVGRLFLVRPIYEELARTAPGLERGRRIYAGARERYHAVTRRAIDEILGTDGGS